MPEPPAWTPVVGVAIVEDGRLLLVRRRDDGSWCLPGGRLRPRESFEEAAVRECREELGHEVTITGFVGAGSNPEHQIHRYPNGDLVHFIGVVFSGRLGPRVQEPDGEVVAQGWFGSGDLPEKVLAGDLPAIRHVLSGSELPLID